MVIYITLAILLSHCATTQMQGNKNKSPFHTPKKVRRTIDQVTEKL